MRTHIKARVVGGALLALSLSACDFVSPITTDPNAVSVVTLDQLFTGIQVNTYFVAEGQLSRLAAVYTQQMTGTDRQFATIDRYVLIEEDSDDEFSTIYTGGGLIDMKAAIALAEEQGRRPYAGILKIHQAYMFGTAASLWGDIPYSQASDPAITEPVLDDQAAVYASIQTLLDAAIADLGAAGAGPGAADFSFQGNAARWIAVARTLKARFHLHMAESTAGTARYASALAEANQGIAANTGNWRAIHSSSSTENNLWYTFMSVQRTGYISAGDYLVPSMVARNDPRLPFYFSQASGGGYRARGSQLATTAGGYGALDFNTPLVTCAENQYIKAEAQYRLGNIQGAKDAAIAGLVCEETRFTPNVDLSAQKATITAASGQALLDEIMLQKYTALFLNIEVWNDWKRTCLPRITQRAGGMPGRLYYGQSERQSNTNIPETSAQPKRNDNDPVACS